MALFLRNHDADFICEIRSVSDAVREFRTVLDVLFTVWFAMKG